MDWVLLTYGIIFGAIVLYLLSLWKRVHDTGREVKDRII